MRRIKYLLIFIFLYIPLNIFILKKVASNTIYFYPTKVTDISIKRDLVESIYNDFKINEHMTLFPEGSAGRVQKLSSTKLVRNDEKFLEGIVVSRSEFIEKLESLLKDINLKKDEIEDISDNWEKIIKKTKSDYFVINLDIIINHIDDIKVEPKPDQLIELTINVKPIGKKIILKEQSLKRIERVGFSILSVVDNIQ